MDVNSEIRRAVATGKVALGVRRTIKSLRAKRAKLVIVASNCRADSLASIERYSKLSGAILHRYAGDSFELGTASGKPFSVNAMAVLDPGGSSLMAAVTR